MSFGFPVLLPLLLSAFFVNPLSIHLLFAVPVHFAKPSVLWLLACTPITFFIHRLSDQFQIDFWFPNLLFYSSHSKLYKYLKAFFEPAITCSFDKIMRGVSFFAFSSFSCTWYSTMFPLFVFISRESCAVSSSSPSFNSCFGYLQPVIKVFVMF